ncbi:phage tail protein [Mesorhizobium sp. KR1-2]|uniref:phage tail protein n=1 Tax=Mesorhizobium sp. KR1-2 TaxID=3156609 RepID=UPI0032B441C2
MLAGICLPALTSHAFADPVSIGSFVISALLSVGAGSILPAVSAAVIGNVVIGAAVVGLSLLSSIRGQAPKIDPGQFKSTFESGDSSEIRAVGRVRVGGLKAFGNTSGGKNRYRLICHTRGKVTAVEQHFLGEREVKVEPNGAVSSPPWARKNGSWVTIKNKVGDGTETAWPDLVSAFPTLWTADHRLRGIAQSLVKYVSPGFDDEDAQKKFQQLYQGGVPDYERVQLSEPVFDPRTTGQSATGEGTWAYRDNGILCGAHILRSYPSLAAADFDYAVIATEATKADALAATRTGTEPRARSWGMWTSETPRGQVMEQFLRSIGAEIVQTDDNRIALRLIDDVRVPEITIPARHVIDLQYRSGPESVERPNICRVKYYSPERNYEMSEIDLTGIAWARVQEEIDRVGEQIYDVDLPFCPSAAQAQRIARRLFALARADAGVLKTNFVGMAAWGKTVAAIEIPDLDIIETCAIGAPRVNDDEGTVEIPFVVWPTLPPWNPSTDEALPPPEVPDMSYESELDTPARPSTAAVVRYPDGSYETRVKFTAVAGGASAEAVYRTYDGGEPKAYASMTEYADGGLVRYAYDAANTAGKKAEFKCRFFNADGDGSYFSPLLTIDPMVIDNTPCAAPEIAGTMEGSSSSGMYHISGSIVSNDMRVARLVTDDFNGPARPGQSIAFSRNVSQGTYDETITITAIAYTSDGTPSPTASRTFTVPGTGHG